jgi:hypothetical protein
VDDAGDTGFPRGRALVHWNEDDKAMLVVVAPLLIGHRSVLADEVLRRWTQSHGQRQATGDELMQ